MNDLPPDRSGDIEARTDEIVHGFLTSLRIPAATVGIQRGGRTILVKGYGYADVENDIPAAPWTVYRIGSITKQFTAAAIMLLIERGTLQSSDTLGTLLRDVPPQGRDITVEQLLTHTSGIKNYTELPEFAARSRLDLPQTELARMVSNEPLEFEPGNRFQYSNSNYYLLGIIIEVLTGGPYYAFMEGEIFAPLQLTQTTYLDDYRIIKHRAGGYDLWNGRTINASQISMILPFAAGALGSTAPDLLAWQTALVNAKLIGPESYRRMTTPGRLNDGSRTTYGYGVTLGTMEGHRKLFHGGTINGFRSQLAYYPDDDLGIAVLCNHGSALPEILESRLARAVLGIPERIVDEHAPPPALERFVGVYAAGSVSVPVALENGALQMGGARLQAVGDHTFVLAHDPYAEITFHDRSLAVEREGQRTEYQKRSETAPA